MMSARDDPCGSFTSFQPSRRVEFAPRADIRRMPALMSTRPNERVGLTIFAPSGAYSGKEIEALYDRLQAKNKSG